MTQFHLNKTPCFDQNGGILTKQKQEKKKKKADDLLYGYCSSSPIFLLKKTARVATFLKHLMIHFINQIEQTIHHYDDLTS
jgi:hypothetical protein